MASVDPTKFSLNPVTGEKTPLRATKWRARYRTPDGDSRSRTFDRKRDAEVFLAGVAGDMLRGEWVDPELGRITFREWVDHYRATTVDLRETTIDRYDRELDGYLVPRFGRSPLSALKPLAIRQWLADEKAAGRSPSSTHRRFRILRRVLQVAVENEVLVKNPCVGVKPPVVTTSEMRFLSASEVADLAHAIGPWYSTLILTAAYAGPRFGELAGMRRKQVDLLRRKITIDRQLTRVQGRAVYSSPKTKAGTRTVSIPRFLAGLLESQLSERAQPGAEGLVFPNKAGHPLIASSFTANVFKRAVEKTSLGGRLRFHDLRHTAVALAIAQGAHPKAIQARMGHASIQVTLDRYGHLFPELDEQIADGLDATFRAVKPTQRRVVRSITA